MPKKPKKRIRKKQSRGANSSDARIAELEKELKATRRALHESRAEVQTLSSQLAEAQELIEYSDKRAEIAEEFVEVSQRELEETASKLCEAEELIDYTIHRAEVAEEFAGECADAESEVLVLRFQYEEVKAKLQASRDDLEHAKSSLTLLEEAAGEAEERAYFVEKELFEAEQRAREAGATLPPKTSCPCAFDKYMLAGALEVAVRQAKRHQRKVAMINFRVLRVKETSELEPILAKRLKKVVRDSDLFAQVAPFTFAVLIAEQEPEEKVTRIIKALAKRTDSAFTQTLEFNGERYFPKVAMGVSVFPLDANSSKEVMRHAEVALSEAVQVQSPGVHYYR